ncbi:hypothetical protein EDD21DRAFT_327148, partial [Dissophora ornata]
MQKSETSRKPYTLSHQKVAIDVDFCNQTLLGSTELYILPLVEDLSVIHINCRQIDVISVSINSVLCRFTYQDSIKDSLGLLKEGTINNHLDLKRRWTVATAEDDEGELAIAIPQGMIVPSMMDEDTINRASNVVDTVRDTSTPEPSTPQTPAAAPVLSSGVNFATLTVRIDFKLESPTAGVFFTGPDPINAPNRAHSVYTINQPLPGATRLWLPCLDRLAERCTWDIDFIVPAFAPEEDLAEDEEGWSPDDYGEDEKVQVICSGDLIQQSTHHSIASKNVFHYSIPVPTPAASISFVAGVFEVIKLSREDYAIQELDEDADTGDNEDGEREESEKPTAASNQIRSSIPDMFVFCPPGRTGELRHSCGFMTKAMEFFMHEIGSYPFSSFKMVFVEDAWAPTFTSATMAVCSTSLLYPEDVIDQVYETRKLLTQALAQQWFGIHIVPKSWPDIWIIVGLTNFVTSLFLKKMFGNNEYRFRMKKDIERCCTTDRDRPPLYNPNIAYPIDLDDLEFIGLKAPLVLHMLDKRMSKGGSSLGLSRVIPKILVSVMSGELTHNAISTHWFLKTCRKVSGLETKGFSDQWIYNSGCPIFEFNYHFNRKKMVVEINMSQRSTNDHGAGRTKMSMNSEHPPPTIFTGTMTARIHEADGTPYEHVLDIQDARKRFEVQFNTKYKRIRRNTKRFQAKQAAAAAAAREAEEEGDIEDGIGALGFGAGLWEDEKEKEEWQVVEWGQDDENGAISATFEWIRLDAEFEWLCELEFMQPDFMWAAQLQKDRDVVAQYEAIQALENLPSPAASTSLLKTLLDTRCFFRVRMEAAYAIARCATPQTDWVGLLHLTKTFQHKYCYPPTHATNFQSPDGTIPCMPKPNDFSSLAEYYVQKAIPIALANIRDERGYCPVKVRQFLLDLLRFNDNTGNVFSDNFYVSTLISALAHSFIPSRSKHDLSKMHDKSRHEDDDDEFEAMDEDAGYEVLEQAMREIDRYRTLDSLIPTYHNTVTVSCLQAAMRLMVAGIVPKDLKIFVMHSRFGNFVNVRLTSFDSLLLLGALDNFKASEYLCNVIEEDPSPYVRFHVAQSLAEYMGVLIAHKGLVGQSEQESLLIEENGISNRRDAIGHANDKKVMQRVDLVRKLYGHQPVLQREVWKVLTSYPYLEHRILKYLLLFCDILYPPGESILHKLKFRAPIIEDVVMREPSPIPESTPATVFVPAVSAAPAPLPTFQPLRQTPVVAVGTLPASHVTTDNVPIPVMAPELVAAMASSPIMQQAREPIQTPAPVSAITPITVTTAPTVKVAKAKTETPKPPKVTKAKAPSGPAASQANKPSLLDTPKLDVSTSLSPRIKEELTSPTLAAPAPPRSLPEPKEVTHKAPSKKPEPKPKPASAVPKDSVGASTVTVAAKLDKNVAPIISAKLVAEEKSRKAPHAMPAEHLKQCRKVWRKMFNHRSSAHFRMPVDPVAENIPNYFLIVKRPMDLSTIKGNLDNGKYANLQGYEEDVRLMLSNCFKFNPIGSYVYTEGQELETVFENEWAGVLENVGAKVPEMNITIVETPKSSAAIAPTTVHAISKPASTEPLPAGPKSSPLAAKKSTTPKQTPVPAYIPPSVSLTDRAPSPLPSAPKEKPPVVVGTHMNAAPVSRSSSASKTADLAKCKKILKKLTAAPCAFEFLQPVDPERQGIPLYLKIITEPMDLGTIQTKLRTDVYNNAGEVRKDLDLVVSNCRKFNPRESYVVQQADALEQLMLIEWESAFGSNSYTGVTDSAPSKDSAVTVGSSKPKAKVKAEEVPKVPSAADSAARRPSNTPKPKPSKVVEKGIEPPKDVVQKHMDRILKRCVNHKHAGPFLQPVDWRTLNLPDYPVLIKNPMDFSTIREKLDNGKYVTMDDFADDVRLVCQNCVNFNGLDHPFSQGGLLIQTLLNKEVENAKKELARLYPTSSYATASIIDRLKLNQDFGVFAVPVDPIALGIPTYFDVIKEPMDFGTIEKKLIAGQYSSGAEVIKDVNLVFSNCALFNSHPGDPVAVMGQRLKK